MIDRISDVIYGRKHGMALTLDVFAPHGNHNGKGIIFVSSGGWYSSRILLCDLASRFIEPLAEHGYTVFAIVPSSKPRFTIPEMKDDVQRAIRFVRYHATEHSIDVQRLGIYGLSAGGHLSLLAGLTADTGNPDAEDEVERESCTVQAIAEFYAPTDFFNYGGVGENAVEGLLANFKSAFDFCELDAEANRYHLITDAARVEETVRQCSPIGHLRPDVPPIFIIHGDADPIVPFQQSQLFLEKAKQVGAPVELQVVADRGHGWDDMSSEVSALINWFDRNL